MSLLAPLPGICGRRGLHWRRRCSSFAASLELDVKKIRQPHTPVLLNQVLAQFEGCSLNSFVDCTLGAGGHSYEIIRSHPELRHFVGLDVDSHAIELAKKRLNSCSSSELHLDIVRTNFRNVKSVMEKLQLAESGVDGILMDLGVSSMQVDAPERGFSYHLDGPLDMRMDTEALCNAATILNEWPEAELGRVLRDYGEEKRWKFLARRFVDSRSSGGVNTTAELVKLIGGKYFSGKNKMKHPAMRTFQALRIAVNEELKSLELALSQALECLSPGGRLAVITFHSLEDRIVKHHFLNVSSRRDRPCSTLGLDVKEDLTFQLTSKKQPFLPDEQEMEDNPRCKSAKLRAIQRLT